MVQGEQSADNLRHLNNECTLDIYDKIFFLFNVYVFCIAFKNNIAYTQLYPQLWKYVKEKMTNVWICIRFTKYNTKRF